MVDRAHIRHDGTDWQVIRKYNSEKGRIIMESGDTLSPVVIGSFAGNDKVVDVVVVTNDTSTGADIDRSVVETIEGGTVGSYLATDRVLRTITIRDLTAQEVTDRGVGRGNAEWKRFSDDHTLDAIRDTIHRYNNRIRELEAQVVAIAALLVPPLDLSTVDANAWTKTQLNDWLKARVQDSVDNG